MEDLLDVVVALEGIHQGEHVLRLLLGELDGAEAHVLRPGDERSWSYRLAKGFPIYWDLRQKARPLPLRVVQSFFGH